MHTDSDLQPKPDNGIKESKTSRREFGIGATALSLVALSGITANAAAPTPICYSNAVPFLEQTGSAFPAFGLWLIMTTGSDLLIDAQGNPQQGVPEQLPGIVGLSPECIRTALTFLKANQAAFQSMSDLFQAFVALYRQRAPHPSLPAGITMAAYSGSHCPGSLNSISPVTQAIANAKPAQ